MNTVLFFQTKALSPSREKVAGALRYAESSPWDVQLVEINLRPAEIRNAISHWKPLGCIVERGLSKAKTPERLFAGIPVVYIDQNSSNEKQGQWCILHDSKASVRMAFKELTRGKPVSYAFVRDARSLAWNREREQEFLRLAADKVHFVLNESLSLSEKIKELPKPCGLLAATDQLARKVVDAARKEGVSIPEELRIAGINNDTFLCEHLNPTLTSVHPDFEGCGYLAMSILHRIVSGSAAKARTIMFGPKELVRRTSTRILSSHGGGVARALDYIESNFSSPYLDSDHVAAAMGCSRRLADMRFRKATGRTIRDEIRRRRIEQAKTLLADHTRDLSAVPSLCGCLSQTTFMRFFKSMTGMTMSEYRRGRRNLNH
jgi:LacI family transcriptional regulator